MAGNKRPAACRLCFSFSWGARCGPVHGAGTLPRVVGPADLGRPDAGGREWGAGRSWFLGLPSWRSARCGPVHGAGGCAGRRDGRGPGHQRAGPRGMSWGGQGEEWRATAALPGRPSAQRTAWLSPTPTDELGRPRGKTLGLFAREDRMDQLSIAMWAKVGVELL